MDRVEENDFSSNFGGCLYVYVLLPLMFLVVRQEVVQVEKLDGTAVLVKRIAKIKMTMKSRARGLSIEVSLDGSLMTKEIKMRISCV